MKIKHPRLCAVLCGLISAALMTGSVVTAFAADAPPPADLTIADAVKFTLSSNTSYLNLLDTGALNTQSRADAINSFLNGSNRADPDGSEWIKTEAQLMQYDAKIALQSSNETEKRLSLQHTLTKYFMNIITAEKSLDLSRMSLENNAADLNILRTKEKLGLISQTELATAETSFEKAKNDLSLKESAIASAYVELNRLMGKPVDSRYQLILDFAYKPLGDIDMVQLTDQALKKSTSIQQKKSDLEIADYKLEQGWWVFSSITEYNKSDLEIQAAQARRALDDAKEELRAAINTAYSDIQTLETQISSNTLELANMRKQLEIKQVELRLGKTTALELKKYELQVLQLEETLRQQVYNHQLMVWQFDHPEVLSAAGGQQQ